MALPHATYRMQFRKEFPFSACADQADYLSQLGVSHVYASPILTARAGSPHGYDVVRYDQINPELGGEAGFHAMAAALRRRDIGIILDIVPNHVAVGGGDNPMWLDCLKHGRASRYASWFDIDFGTPDPELAGKIHAPFLGEPLQRALDLGHIKLCTSADGAGFEFRYGEHVFPVRPEDQHTITQDGLVAWQTPEALQRLLSQQHYVLDSWRNAGDRINWRRFFDITQLAAIRMVIPAAFEAAHAVPFALYQEGLIDGLRIDHIDGLADPAAYCRKLRGELDARQLQRPSLFSPERAWLVVEKILAPGEPLATDWDVDGTTGYDFMDQVSALQHELGSDTALTRYWAQISGCAAGFHDEEIVARRLVLDTSFDGQRERLVDQFASAAGERMAAQGVTRAALRRACTAVMIAMRAYRGYASGTAMDGAPGPQIKAALREAAESSMADQAALALIADGLSGRFGTASDCAEMLRRFNQLSAPLAAKAVEDTAFYRYGRLLSRNDVGFDAARLGLDPGAFHRLMEGRATSAASSMLATATHDHKRGEDVRARLAVLSEMPEVWFDACDRWAGLTQHVFPEGLAAGDRYMFQQMLVGCWPLELDCRDQDGLRNLAERLSGWWIKALREAKLQSSWVKPDEKLELAAERFVATSLDPVSSGPYLDDVATFVGMVARAGAVNGLTQMALRCLAPGIPDVYQGTEFWDFSLVDPDNRRPVDFSARRHALAASEPMPALVASWRDGRIKQALLQSLLSLRGRLRGVFSHGSYEPLRVSGVRARHLLAFVRQHGDDMVVVLIARCLAGALKQNTGLVPEADWWGDTVVSFPDCTEGWTAVTGYSPVPEGCIIGGDASPAALMGDLPLGVWTGTRIRSA